MASDAADADLPALGPLDLGCRVKTPNDLSPYDVRPDPAGMVGRRVKPEGMSAFDDPWQMPPNLKPRSLGGTSDRPVWNMPVPKLPSSLDFIQSGRSHGVVAPIEPVHVDGYLQAIASTQMNWNISHV